MYSEREREREREREERTKKKEEKKKKQCYKPFGNKDQDGHFLNVVDFIDISPNLRGGLWNLLYFLL